MSSANPFRQRLLRAMVRFTVKPVLHPRFPITFQRRYLGLATSLLNVLPRGTQVTSDLLGGVPTKVVRHPQASEQHAVLYLHGGAYCVGSPGSHGGLIAHLARDARAVVYGLDYRLAPEHPFPAALDDALSAYRGLLAKGLIPAQIAIAGDSAGGGLALATAIAIRDAGLPQPAALYLISPWVDLQHTGASITANAGIDVLLAPAWTRACAAFYAGDIALDDPRLSPLNADLKQLPPMLIQVGSDEVLMSDSERLAERARLAKTAAQLVIYPQLWHVFHLQAGLLPAANRALQEAAVFLNACWKRVPT